MESIQGIYKQNRYRRSFWLFASGFLGFIIYLLPSFLSFIKILLFLVPIAIFCYAMSGTRSRFNWLFFIILLLFILICSSILVTNLLFLSADAEPPTIDYPEFNAPVVFNTIETIDSINSIIQPIIFFVIWFVIIVAIAGSIYALIIGQVSQAMTGFLRAFCIIIVLVFFVLIADMYGFNIPGLTDTVKAVSDWYLNAIKTIYDWMQTLGAPAATTEDTPGSVTWTINQTFGQGTGQGSTSDAGVFAEADTNQDGTVDFWEAYWYNLFNQKPYLSDAFKANPTFFQIGLISAVPMLISGLNFVFGLLFLSKRFRERNDRFFDRIKIKVAEPEVQASKSNYRLITLGVIVWLFGWFLFLYYKKIYSSDENLNIFDVLKLIWYTGMITFSISLIPRGIYTQGTWKTTVIGTILGFSILYLSFNFLYGTTKTLDAYYGEYNGYLWYQVLNTFVYVAPAESLFFHILLPSLFLMWLYNKSQAKIKNDNELLTKDKNIQLGAEILFFEDLKSTYPKGTKNLRQITKKILELKRKQKRLEYKLTFEKERFVFERFNLYVLFYAFIIVVNFLFSLTHYIVISDRMDFFVFWLSGLGIIYLISGTIITILGWKFGWTTAILIHAFYNITQIIIAVYIFGVVI